VYAHAINNRDDGLYEIPRAIVKATRGQDINPDGIAESDFRIASDGTWFYHGSPILRKSLVKLFATILKREKDGSFWLVTPVERAKVTVDDAPFLVIAATRTGSGENQILKFETNLGDTLVAGEEHPIRVIVNPENGQPAPYIQISHGIEALITRSVFYDLVEWAEEDFALGELFIQSNRKRFSLGLFAEKDEAQ